MVIRKLSDIQIYTQSQTLSHCIYSITRKNNLRSDYSLVDQIRRACLSVTANIAEGYGRKTKKDFIHFLSIALGSANEVVAFLEFIEIEYCMNLSDLKTEYGVLIRKIYSFRRYLGSCKNA